MTSWIGRRGRAAAADDEHVAASKPSTRASGFAPAKQGAALTLLAAPSVAVLATVYGLYIRSDVPAAGEYSLGVVIVTPITVFAGLGIRTMLLSHSRLALGQAHLLRLLLIPASVAASVAVAAVVAPSIIGLVALIAILRGLDSLAEITLASCASADRFARVYGTGGLRIGLILAVTVGMIALGASAVPIVFAQCAVAAVWYMANDLRSIPSPVSEGGGRQLLQGFRRLAPLGFAGVASVAAFSLPASSLLRISLQANLGSWLQQPPRR